MMERETRVFSFEDLEVRQATADEPPVIRGYAAVYNSETDLGEFREVVRPGAFADAIGRDDVRALFNHDPNYVLGRNRAGTLKLDDDSDGLKVLIMPPDTQWARDLITSMDRGDVNQMSFAFSVDKQEMNYEQTRGKPLRELQAVTLYDVSVVTYPAYPETSAQARQEARDLMSETDADIDQAGDGQSDNKPDDTTGQARRVKMAKVKIQLKEREVNDGN